MAKALANQGRRIEEAIDLDEPERAPREATYSPDSDVVALPTPVKSAFEVIDLDSDEIQFVEEEAGEASEEVFYSASSNPEDESDPF